MHILGVGSPEFEGPNIFAKTSQQNTGHKQHKEHTHWRHREPVYERETAGEALIANARIVLRGMTRALHLIREQFAPADLNQAEAAVPLGDLATHTVSTTPVQQETAA